MRERTEFSRVITMGCTSSCGAGGCGERRNGLKEQIRKHCRKSVEGTKKSLTAPSVLVHCKSLFRSLLRMTRFAIETAVQARFTREWRVRERTGARERVYGERDWSEREA